MYCRWCGEAIPHDGVDSIHVCGPTDRPPAFCMNCGAPLAEGNTFCTRCAMPAGVAPYRPTASARATTSVAAPTATAVPPEARDPDQAGWASAAPAGFVAAATPGSHSSPGPAARPAWQTPPTNPLAIVSIALAGAAFLLGLPIGVSLLSASHKSYLLFVPLGLLGVAALWTGQIASSQIAAATEPQGGAKIASLGTRMGIGLASLAGLMTISFVFDVHGTFR
jgi:zinc-ribbon domain